MKPVTPCAYTLCGRFLFTVDIVNVADALCLFINMYDVFVFIHTSADWILTIVYITT